jgi:hypothetical protein
MRKMEKWFSLCTDLEIHKEERIWCNNKKILIKEKKDRIATNVVARIILLSTSLKMMQ